MPDTSRKYLSARIFFETVFFSGAKKILFAEARKISVETEKYTRNEKNTGNGKNTRSKRKKSRKREKCRFEAGKSAAN